MVLMALTKYNAESYSTSGNYVINMALKETPNNVGVGDGLVAKAYFVTVACSVKI